MEHVPRRLAQKAPPSARRPLRAQHPDQIAIGHTGAVGGVGVEEPPVIGRRDEQQRLCDGCGERDWVGDEGRVEADASRDGRQPCVHMRLNR